MEATFRIFAFALHDKSHTIVRLQIHQPNLQSVVFSPDNVQGALDNAARDRTMLLQWFALNIRDQNARRLLYTEVPKYYTWNDREYLWKNRKTAPDNRIISRIYSISPRNVELYHLRILLHNVRGAQSFKALRTVNGVVYDTFCAAAIALNLVDNDEQWRRTMQEAAREKMPGEMRFMFAIICLYTTPQLPSPLDLWNEFSIVMSEDYAHRGDNVYTASNKALQVKKAEFKII